MLLIPELYKLTPHQQEANSSLPVPTSENMPITSKVWKSGRSGEKCPEMNFWKPSSHFLEVEHTITIQPELPFLHRYFHAEYGRISHKMTSQVMTG